MIVLILFSKSSTIRASMLLGAGVFHNGSSALKKGLFKVTFGNCEQRSS